MKIFLKNIPKLSIFHMTYPVFHPFRLSGLSLLLLIEEKGKEKEKIFIWHSNCSKNLEIENAAPYFEDFTV